MLLNAIRDALTFGVCLIVSVAVPGLVWLYSDWKHGRGWFNDRA